MSAVCVIFGFGPIGAGLFARETLRACPDARVVAVEADAALVRALRAARGRYGLNVAERDGRRAEMLGPVEPRLISDPQDRAAVAEALALLREGATALPSVDFYTRGAPSVADLLAEAADRKAQHPALPSAIVYCGENHNHAAELLAEAVARRRKTGGDGRIEFLNTVIGKMSRVVADPAEIRRSSLVPAADGIERAWLVEAFNAILVSRPRTPHAPRLISAFAEKDDLLPSEEAKLYGHNAVHALIGFLAAERGIARLAAACAVPEIAAAARAAFLEESGAALCRKHAGRDPLFTEAGWRAYAEDLLDRMANPHLDDDIARVIRDPLRKLGWNDRIVGTMRMALAQGITPRHFARAAASALRYLGLGVPAAARPALLDLWSAEHPNTAETEQLWPLLEKALNGVLP